jgi:hypothetical protein
MVEKDWAFEQVLAALEQARAEGMEWFDPSGPVPQWCALQKLDALEQQFGKGDDFALLHAIRVCANHDLVIPKWAALAYIKRFDAVLTCKTGSWDGAFGRPYRNGFHLVKARQRRQLRFAVYVRVREILEAEPGTAVDESLFERVGDEFDIGKTLCNRLYYEVKRIVELTPTS